MNCKLYKKFSLQSNTTGHMIINKIKYSLTRIFNRISFERISFTDIFANISYVVIIVVLGINIFTTFNKGLDDTRKFQAEQTKLKVLQDENIRLTQELEKYGSIEYKRIYARENLNLAEKKETLYYVDRKNINLDIEKLPEDTVQINLDDNLFWWKKLILGI